MVVFKKWVNILAATTSIPNLNSSFQHVHRPDLRYNKPPSPEMAQAQAQAQRWRRRRIYHNCSSYSLHIAFTSVVHRPPGWTSQRHHCNRTRSNFKQAGASAVQPDGAICWEPCAAAADVQ